MKVSSSNRTMLLAMTLLMTGVLAQASFSGSALAASADAEAPAAVQNWRDISEFNHLDPKHVVPDKPLERALMYFNKNRGSFKNSEHIGVIDFTMPSTQKRFFIINLKTGAVEIHEVAHGIGSGAGTVAKHFSNVNDSRATSLGFYRTGATFMSPTPAHHGLSLTLYGLSATNSNVKSRDVVLHGAWYVSDSANVAGHSWGCPAVDLTQKNHIIDELKDGALIYAYGGQGE